MGSRSRGCVEDPAGVSSKILAGCGHPLVLPVVATHDSAGNLIAVEMPEPRGACRSAGYRLAFL